LRALGAVAGVRRTHCATPTAVVLKDDAKINHKGDAGTGANVEDVPMKRSTKHILAGLLVAGIVFVVLCGALKALASASTFNVVNPILLAVVVVSWLAWSFKGHFRRQREHA
jgi:hypothetical protein